VSAGAQQDTRRPPALRGDGFLADERSLADELALLARFTRVLGRDHTGAPAWGALLDRDPSVLIARVLAYPAAAAQSAFLDDMAAHRSAALAHRLGEAAGWLKRWLDDVAAAPGLSHLAVRIEQTLIAALGPDWQARSGQSPGDSAQALLRKLSEWVATSQQTPSARDLRVMFSAVLTAFDQLRSLLEPELPRSLESASHEPAAALVLALTQTLRPVLETLNTFTASHLDFYYHDCLGFRPLGARADTVHLVVRRDPKLPSEFPVSILGGQPFMAGRDPSGEDIVFAALDTLDVTDAQVVSLKTLRLERSPVIAPECELGFVTRARAAEFAADIGPEDVMKRDTAALMGGDVTGCLAGGGDARIGLAVSSPILLMEQGERVIELTLAFELPKSAPEIGDAFALWLLTDGAPPPVDADFASRYAVASDPTDPLVLFVGTAEVLKTLVPDGQRLPTLAERRTLARQQLYPDFFNIEVSTPTGWFSIGGLAPVPSETPAPDEDPERPTAPGALKLRLRLLNEDPPIAACVPAIHGAEWPAGLAALKLTANPLARLYPLSLFDRAELQSVTLDVAVTGLRNLKAYNQMGQVDPSKPFQPFGPLPDLGAYLVVGSPEIANKPLTSCTAVLEWGVLPPLGFSDYYDGYDGAIDDDSFKVRPSLLRDGNWVAAGGDRSLFAVRDGVLVDRQALALDPGRLGAGWRPRPGSGAYDQNARDGLIRFQLSAPADGFGQRLYPSALSAALRPRLFKIGDEPPAIPNPPYSPVVSRLTLNYGATSRISVNREPSEERLLHLYPFGVKTIHPVVYAASTTVLPRLEPDGSLFIGLQASQLQGPLSLLFELQKDTASEDVARNRAQEPGRQGLFWSWLSGDTWTVLDDKRISQDTTSGFLTSGIVRLDLPPGPALGSTQLDSGLFWVRVASRWTSDSFAGLQGVHAQALRAARVDPERALHELPDEQITIKSARIPGIVDIRQPTRSTGLLRAETVEQERTRVAERLRHKTRAATPWDVERLVLEKFPSVYKVRCLPHARLGAEAPQPGSMLVVVVPTAPPDDADYATRALQLDALAIEEIAEFLPPLASPHATIRVHNATYERIQVRCEVDLSTGARFGDTLRRLNGKIVDYLSPWRKGGHPASFDWVIRADDLEAAIRNVQGVRDVSGLSLISVREVVPSARPGPRRDLFDFGDTAVTESRTDQPVIRARWPWTLALPVAEHLVSLQGGVPARPTPTGLAVPGIVADATVGGLEIGSTFIVGGV
jgi:hypothetical protein